MYLLDSTIKHLNNWDLWVYNIFWHERGSGFGKAGGTPPPRTTRSTHLEGGGGGGGGEGAENPPGDLHWGSANTPMGSKSIGQEMRLLFY